MSNSRQRPSQGTSAASSRKARAQQLIAAEQAARKGAERRRRVLLCVAAVAVVPAIVGALVVFKPAAPRPAAAESQAPALVVRRATTVPLSVLMKLSPGQAPPPLQAAPAAGPPLTVNGKPAIVFVSEESCPFCAAERWPLVVALSHFGTWSHLGATRSSATDVYPNTATLSFRAARYSSAELALRTTELTDNRGHPLQAQTP